MRRKSRENSEIEEKLTKCKCSLLSFIHLFNIHDLTVNYEQGEKGASSHGGCSFETFITVK